MAVRPTPSLELRRERQSRTCLLLKKRARRRTQRTATRGHRPKPLLDGRLHQMGRALVTLSTYIGIVGKLPVHGAVPQDIFPGLPTDTVEACGVFPTAPCLATSPSPFHLYVIALICACSRARRKLTTRNPCVQVDNWDQLIASIYLPRFTPVGFEVSVMRADKM